MLWGTLTARAPSPVAPQANTKEPAPVYQAEPWGDDAPQEWSRAKAQMDSPELTEPPSEVVTVPTGQAAGGYILHDIHPPLERAQQDANAGRAMIRLKGDSSRRRNRRGELGWQSDQPDWSDKSTARRGERGLVTDVSPPNRFGNNPDWAGVISDPADQPLRDPAIGDWWLS